MWGTLFSDEKVVMGNQGNNRMDIFQYMTRSTHWRPRDYIHYITECAKLALSKGERQISPRTVKEVDREFSEYLKDEIVDEIYGVLPEISDIFSLLSQIRKQTFSTSEFVKLYDIYSKNNDKAITSAENILRLLFEHGVIGNQPSMKGQQIFKHEYPNALFNFKENVVIHRGLYKALQIF